MIYTYLDQLPKEFNFVKTGNIEYEHEFVEFLNCNKDINVKINSSSKENEINITLDPTFYFDNHENEKINLFIISVDKDNSFFLNFVKYIKSNNFETLDYDKNYFIKFLIENFPLRNSKWFIVKFLNYFKLSIRKNFIYKGLWLPKFIKRENIFNGKLIGKGDYNCYLQRSKSFENDFKFVYENLSNSKSKKNYQDVVYGRPQIIWKNYFDNLKGKEHYQHHLNFNKSSIINLGVELGFEIPFFLSHNIKSIINVDPSGEKNLHKYVKLFLRYYKDKIFFEKSCLYESSRIPEELRSDNMSVNLRELIKKYNLKENIIIKSDIEGLEIKMLDEIPGLIKEFRPQLAISIYHLDNNLFPNHAQITLIPKILIKNCKNYKFYIEHYTYNRGETVFYCIPN